MKGAPHIVKGKLIAAMIGVLILGITGWFEVSGHHTAPNRSLLAATRSQSGIHQSLSQESSLQTLEAVNDAETNAILNTISIHNPALRASHGVITPSLVGVNLTGFTVKPNQITGVNRTWHILQASLSHPPATILPHPLPSSVWRTGWEEAARAVMTVLGNDPLAVVKQAGPGDASAFLKLEQIAYGGIGDEVNGHHYALSMISAISPNITIYPPPQHTSAGEPPIILQMRVPIVVTQYTALVNPSNKHQTIPRTVVQKGTALMVLTHLHHHYYWWVAALSTQRPQAVHLIP
ncbi:hypothetical protein [Sulfobacillus thermosulfidooxidans]|uniref:hypothetical protein n=1 Tax=Sulfobacillus thermosulfidooxidans TaxID=28034 RepID=UPI0006B63E8C|nr:hypothetical protein [Sulfobacillus thermosulfidooxidans]